jgi:hypothetical protein
MTVAMLRTTDRPSDLSHQRAARMKSVITIAAIISIGIAVVDGIAQAISSTPIFEGSTTTLAKNGTTQAVHVSVQSWAITGENRGDPKEIPLRGFYTAHLLSGIISTTIDGQTTAHLPGDYWTVKPGAIMQVKVIGEVAVMETIVMAKQ